MDIILATVVIIGGIIGLTMLQRNHSSRNKRIDKAFDKTFNETMKALKRQNRLHRAGLLETNYMFTEYGLKLYEDNKDMRKWFL